MRIEVSFTNRSSRNSLPPRDDDERDRAESEWLAKLQGAKQWNSGERDGGDETTSREESGQAEIAESNLGSDRLQSIHSHLACSDIDADRRNVDSEHSSVDITSLKRKLLADHPPSPLGRNKKRKEDVAESSSVNETPQLSSAISSAASGNSQVRK